ncbi:MAG: HPr(Ser) kinase/phosphatase [Acidobacteriota bacterium]
MKTLAGQEIHPRMSVHQFVDLFSSLSIHVTAGRGGLDREIESPRIQKPGLALAGVHEYIHPERIQILGETEISYLNRWSGEDRLKILQPIFERGICCFLLTKGLPPPEELVSLAEATDTPLLASTEKSSLVINQVTDVLMSALAPVLSVHGVLVDVYGVGLLIIGRGSIGKSESALDLIVRGHRLVSDDVVEIRRQADHLTGTAPELLRYHMELRGLGIINIKELFGVVATRSQVEVELVVELEHWQEKGNYDRLGLDELTISILGLPVPYLLMPVAPGRNITILLEVAVRNLLLKRKGIHSAKDFTRRLQQMLEANVDEPEP